VKACFPPIIRTNFIQSTDYLETASEKCHQEKRKTVNGEDILFAMTSLGFENYAEALKIYLSKYREVSASHQIVNMPNLCFNSRLQNMFWNGCSSFVADYYK
jgi:hypothetical protein